MLNELTKKALAAFRAGKYLDAYDAWARIGHKVGASLVDANLRMCLARNASAPASACSLRLACIMDDFSWRSFAPECDAVQLEPESCVSVMAAFQPHMLFVESAWRGKNELWRGKVMPAGNELRAAIDWCRTHHVPTVFWNKEDPVHYIQFLPTAALFDFVFTTDIGRIAHYKQSLGHERVFYLPFASQPRHFNPLKSYERKRACCFAGSWYAGYTSRCLNFCAIVENLPTDLPLEIFDRNLERDLEHFRFPEKFQPFIKGTLAPEEINQAYKGYEFGLNMNTVKQSQTMFARRVFELMACNTSVISNYAGGLRLLLGDLTFCGDNGTEIASRIRSFSESDLRKMRLLALRKVMSEHCYADRMNRIAEKVFGLQPSASLPQVSVLSRCGTMVEAERVAAFFDCQTIPLKELVILMPADAIPAEIPPIFKNNGSRLLPIEEGGRYPVQSFCKRGQWLTVFSPNDWYGENYLLDLLLATRWWEGPVIGKAERFQWTKTGISLVSQGEAYTAGKKLTATRALVRQDAVSGNISQWLKGVSLTGLAVDPFNYCENGALCSESNALRIVGDLELSDQGVDMAYLYHFTDHILPDSENYKNEGAFSVADLFKLCCKNCGEVKFRLVEDQIRVNSSLAPNIWKYFYAKDLEITKLNLRDGQKIRLSVHGNLNIKYTLIYKNGQKERISHQFMAPESFNNVEIPADARYLRLGLRVQGSGTAAIDSLSWGYLFSRHPQRVTRKRVLLITTYYPAYDNLYKNAFIHTRVKAYKKAGFLCDVFCLHPDGQFSMREFQEIDVMTGVNRDLDGLLTYGNYDAVLVHLLNRRMWKALEKFPNMPKIVWVHGIEIQPWHRRGYNYRSQEELDAAVIKSEERMNLWREILSRPRANLHFVFVSRHFAATSLADVGISLPGFMRSVIHNYINGELFAYVPKTAAMRKKILSIRPFASRIYGNDISVQAILALAHEPFFDELEFRIIGDGELFEEVTGPLAQFPNIRLERKFLTQDEIASLHREYGIFLCPTRMDTQGVSRDEAMASGLVPITNAVEAVPEFVDESCAMLAEEEDYQGIAAGIKQLYADPDLFLRMSAAAAARVRAQSGWTQTIGKELDLIKRISAK